MEPEIPEVQVKVIEPEKELPPPTFEPTPMQVGEAPSEEVSTPAMGKAEIPESTGVSLQAEQEVGDVLEQFEKTVEGIRSTKTINPNVPLEPYPLGQQIYEQRQQFFEEVEQDDPSFPFKLSGGGGTVRIEYGLVYGNYRDGSTALAPQLMQYGTPPYTINGYEGYVYIELEVDEYFAIYPYSVRIEISSSPPVSSYPYYRHVLGYVGNGFVNNAWQGNVSFSVCGYLGFFQLP
jgi:hypothetical protein